jgi:hypothetical protein
MRLPRPRLTVRRLMVVVAIAGVAWWTLLFVARKLQNLYFDESFAIRVWRHHEARRHAEMAKTSKGRRAAFHVSMKAKWEDAAVHPWLPVKPDPSEPE